VIPNYWFILILGNCLVFKYFFLNLQETQRYKDSTEDRKMRFEALKKKDEGSSRLIAKQMKRLKKLQVYKTYSHDNCVQ